MSQSLSRFCPQCNNPLEPGQRFCTNCGATTSIESNAPTALSSDHAVLASGPAQSNSVLAQPTPVANSNVTGQTILTPQTSTPDVSGAPYSTAPTSGDQFYAQATNADVIPPPPPPDSFITTPQEAPAAPYYVPPAPGNKTVPAYAQAPKRSRGCLVASIVLLLVLVLGGVGAFYAFKSYTASNSSNQSSTNGQHTPSSNGTTTSSSGTTPGSGVTTTPGSSGNTPSTGVAVTIPLNLKFTYSSVDITLVSVQQANSFPDDSSTPQGGIRISIKESNPTTKGTNYVYSDVVRLVFPNGTVVPPSGEQNNSGPDSGVSRDNWLDFVMTNQTIDLSKLILRFGSANQQQMEIPLTSNADLSKYQPKTVTPNTPFQYAGMNWTLTSAIKSLSANGQQAPAGQVFITVMLKVDNPTSSEFNAYWGDYIRLKSGNATNTPTTDTTLPLNFAAGSSGATGDVVFVMPSGGASYTLLLLNTPSTPFHQATATFQFQ